MNISTHNDPIKQADNSDFYKRLGVERSASTEDISRAYLNLASKLHPDLNPNPKASDAFKQVAEAYQTLKSADKRAEYDRKNPQHDSKTDSIIISETPSTYGESFPSRCRAVKAEYSANTANTRDPEAPKDSALKNSQSPQPSSKDYPAPTKEAPREGQQTTQQKKSPAQNTTTEPKPHTESSSPSQINFTIPQPKDIAALFRDAKNNPTKLDTLTKKLSEMLEKFKENGWVSEYKVTKHSIMVKYKDSSGVPDEIRLSWNGFNRARFGSNLSGLTSLGLAGSAIALGLFSVASLPMVGCLAGGAIAANLMSRFLMSRAMKLWSMNLKLVVVDKTQVEAYSPETMFLNAVALAHFSRGRPAIAGRHQLLTLNGFNNPANKPISTITDKFVNAALIISKNHEFLRSGQQMKSSGTETVRQQFEEKINDTRRALFANTDPKDRKDSNSVGEKYPLEYCIKRSFWYQNTFSFSSSIVKWSVGQVWYLAKQLAFGA